MRQNWRQLAALLIMGAAGFAVDRCAMLGLTGFYWTGNPNYFLARPQILHDSELWSVAAVFLVSLATYLVLPGLSFVRGAPAAQTNAPTIGLGRTRLGYKALCAAYCLGVTLGFAVLIPLIVFFRGEVWHWSQR
jgi:hypothetical protein